MAASRTMAVCKNWLRKCEWGRQTSLKPQELLIAKGLVVDEQPPRERDFDLTRCHCCKFDAAVPRHACVILAAVIVMCEVERSVGDGYELRTLVGSNVGMLRANGHEDKDAEGSWTGCRIATGDGDGGGAAQRAVGHLCCARASHLALDWRRAPQVCKAARSPPSASSRRGIDANFLSLRSKSS